LSIWLRPLKETITPNLKGFKPASLIVGSMLRYADAKEDASLQDSFTGTSK